MSPSTRDDLVKRGIPRRDVRVVPNGLDHQRYRPGDAAAEQDLVVFVGRLEHYKGVDSIVLAAYQEDVPIFCPAFSDCSAGFGLVAHQHARGDGPKVSIDSVKDFHELTQLKIANPSTGIFMIGGGVPKNFTQDIVVAAEILGEEPPMHKYAVQITVADVRDGALSSSTLKEASSWGKVDTVYEQMVFSEATLAVPLVVGYAYHKGGWKKRKAKRWTRVLEGATQAVG